MERQRQKKAASDRPYDPIASARWRLAHKFVRYGLTPADFDRLLELQGYACAMCHEPFAEGQPIFIDHDHACCPGEKSSCGKCVRGLLDLACNTSLGHIERKYEMARAYLDSPPGQAAVDVVRVA
jgi:recombination endonuclease VII